MSDMRKPLIVVVAILLIFPIKAQAHFFLKWGTGGVYNIPTTLKIKQSGAADLSFTANWDAKPFSDVIFFLLSLGGDVSFLEIDGEIIHTKLSLSNPVPEIQEFYVNNIYTTYIALAFKAPIGRVRFGIGPCIAHTNSTIRNQTFTGTGGVFKGLGYYLAGPSLEVGYELRTRTFLGALYLFLEGKLTATFANVPIQNGKADFDNYALMGIGGLGVKF